MLEVGPIHTTSQRMLSLSVSHPMVTQVRRHVNEPLRQSTGLKIDSEWARKLLDVFSPVKVFIDGHTKEIKLSINSMLEPAILS